MKKKRGKKLDVKSLLVSGFEDGITKLVEIIVIVVALGIAADGMLISIPAVAGGAIVARSLKVILLNK